MAEIKYTTDGKKVVVIGDLNQTEKIVQEIFVTEDGAEIPSGERFVVKSLLDKPAKSWKQKELEELEQRYERERKEWERKIEGLRNEKELSYAALRERVKWLKNVAKEPHQKELKDAISRIADFLSNENKWIVVNDCCNYILEPFNDEGINKLDRMELGYGSRLRYESMRLLSLYGSCDGKLSYKINTYSDGSGSDRDVMFFRNKESALAFIQSKIDEKKEYNSCTIEMAEMYGLKLDKHKLKEYKEGCKKRILNDIESVKKNLDGLQNKLKKLEEQ